MFGSDAEWLEIFDTNRWLGGGHWWTNIMGFTYISWQKYPKLIIRTTYRINPMFVHQWPPPYEKKTFSSKGIF